MEKKIKIEFSNTDIIVFLDFLARVNSDEIVIDEVDRTTLQVLSNIECDIERSASFILEDDYRNQLEVSKLFIKNKYGLGI